ncbi:HNH endonuclease [Actibacterium sp. 188UL27-1]|uniref:HNH endonuclease n=1 Tax=Actibacterium sp. 188UL27-1 TaxID=2786961 RepID=UPI00195E454F|nr:HNH endonuclease [Actibacterium sp. 188UL27-1]MBM7069277.1 HNH endonuclease [Actibacterium sp. 188UL27-1]
MSGYLRNEGVDVNTTRTAYDELGQLNQKYGELATDAALAAGGALPPPAGTAADIASLGRSIWKGDWGGALFDVVGIVPLGGDAIKAGRIANKLNDFRRALDTATTGMRRAFQSTKDAAAKYWDDIAIRNRRAYDEAIAACDGSRACREAAATKKGPQYNNTPKSGDNGEWISGERGDGVWRPANGGPEISYNNGFPDYGPHSAGNVEIPMRGNTSSDFTNADKAMREQMGDPNWRRPRDHTWHHSEDGTTMQLVPKNIHATGGGASTPHMGGASLYGDGSNADAF